MTNLNNKINNLKNGQSIVISKYNGIKVTAEKSGKGDVVRFVRHTGNVSKVFRTVKM